MFLFSHFGNCATPNTLPHSMFAETLIKVLVHRTHFNEVPGGATNIALDLRGILHGVVV